MSGAQRSQLRSLLPLGLWRTPPGLAILLRQEGLPFTELPDDPTDPAWEVGRFVVYDGNQVASSVVARRLRSDQVAIDVHRARAGDTGDPFADLLVTRAAYRSWTIAGRTVTERVAPLARGVLRRRLIGRLRRLITGAGGVWARLAPFPAGYRSAFAFRVDLDEPVPEDYFRFARAREPIADCTTHFVSTLAYGHDRGVLDDLRRHDTQSHGHYHVVVADPDLNRRNLARARAILEREGFRCPGFAAPEGRWNPGLDRAIAAEGHVYSSDFQLGYDDFPFFPWRDEAQSPVLQVPVHPICEGICLEGGLTDPVQIAEYLAWVVRNRIAAGEPAFVYGHPERRLAHLPEIPRELARVVDSEPGVWRTTLTAYADWWLRRDRLRWNLIAEPGAEASDGAGLMVRFEGEAPDRSMALQAFQGDTVATVPLQGAVTSLPLAALAYRSVPVADDLPASMPAHRRPSMRSLARAALDWETVVPIEELPTGSLSAQLKRGLRRLRSRRRAGVGS